MRQQSKNEAAFSFKQLQIYKAHQLKNEQVRALFKSSVLQDHLNIVIEGAQLELLWEEVLLFWHHNFHGLPPLQMARTHGEVLHQKISMTKQVHAGGDGPSRIPVSGHLEL